MPGAAAGLSLRRRCIFWDVVKGSITHLSTRLHVCHVNIRIDSMSIASHRVAPTAAYNAMPRHFLPHHTAAYMPSHYDDPAMRGTAAYDAMDPFATTRSMPPNYVNPHYGYEPLSHAEPMRTSAMPYREGMLGMRPTASMPPPTRRTSALPYPEDRLEMRTTAAAPSPDGYRTRPTSAVPFSEGYRTRATAAVPYAGGMRSTASSLPRPLAFR